MEKYKNFGLLVLTLLFALPAAAQLGEERHNFARQRNGGSVKTRTPFFCAIFGVARNGKQGECIDTRYFCAPRGLQKCLLGSLPKPGRLRDKVSRSGGA